MGIVVWIIFGLLAGVIAKFIMPGNQGGGFVMTTILGVVGAVVGGYLGTHFFKFGEVTGFDIRSMAIAVGGALVVLFVFSMIRSG